MAEQAPQKRGRPKGFKVSEETRRKISEARSKVEVQKRRERKLQPKPVCEACLETGPKVALYVWNPEEEEPKALDTSLLCSFCTRNAPLVGKKGLGI